MQEETVSAEKWGNKKKIAILGAGNIGQAMARGFVDSGQAEPGQIILTRRHPRALAHWQEEGFAVTSDNLQAVRESGLVLMSVRPRQLKPLLQEIRPTLDPDVHVLVSTVTGVPISAMREIVGNEIGIIRAMPNTAIAVRESMTCLAAPGVPEPVKQRVMELFRTVGEVIEIEEELMTAATVLCACGVAFFLRAIRAASQGGVEIGFHSQEALLMAAQTAKGAATLILQTGNHPEQEIDKVTTPRGITISGLNVMEHSGFSSALIKGIVASAKKAEDLLRNGEK